MIVTVRLYYIQQQNSYLEIKNATGISQLHFHNKSLYKTPIGIRLLK